jgi:putative transposase
MSLRFPGTTNGACFFITSTFKNWQNFGGVTGFYESITESLIFCMEKYTAQMMGYVLMPTHIHLLLIIDGPKLSAFMRDFKKYTAQKVALDLKLPRGGIWMPRYDRVSIYSLEVLQTKLQYIHLNPVKNQLVEYPQDWKWSSASEYFKGESGLIPLYKEWG